MEREETIHQPPISSIHHHSSIADDSFFSQADVGRPPERRRAASLNPNMQPCANLWVRHPTVPCIRFH
jgi:hypothetical protein